MSHLGDFDAAVVIYGKFSTYRPSTGATFTLGGTPALSVYKDNSTTQSTSGVTLTADFDGVTGLHHFAIDTSTDGTFYAAGSFFDIVITTGTVDSISVTGSVVGSFTLRKTASIKPTVAGRALDVSAGGEAGIDWANIGSPTTAQNLSATNIDVDQIVASVSGAVGSVTGAVGSVTGNVGGNVTGSVGSVATGGIAAASFAAGAINAAALAADAITAAKIADGAIDAATFAAGAINAAAIDADAITDAKVASDVTIASVTGAVGSVTGNVGGSVGSVATGGIAAASFAAGAINAAAIAADAITDAKVASDVTIASVTGAVGSVTGAVGSVTGNVGGNVTGSVGSVATGGIAAASFAAGAINAAAIANGAIDAATFAAGAIDAAAIANGAIDAATFAPGAIDAAAIATNAIDADALAADAVAEIQSGLATAATLATVKAVTDLLNLMVEVGPGSPTYYRYNAGALELAPTGGSAPSAATIADAVWDEARADHVAAGSFGQGVASVQGNVTGSVASVTADVGITQTGADKVWSTAARLLTAGTNIVLAKGVGVTGFNDLDAAGIRAAVGLASANLDTQLSPLALLQSMIEVGTGSPTYYRYTATALELAPTGGSAPSAAVIADAVWDEARAGHVAAGSFGEGVASVQGNVTGSVASVTADVGITQTGADKVWNTATRLLTAGTNIVLAKGTGVTGFNDLDAAGIRSAVGLASANLDTQFTSNTTNVNLVKTVTDLLQNMIEVGTGSPSYYRFKVTSVELAPSGSAPSAAVVADAVWDEAIAGHLAAGSTGLALSDAGAAGNPWNNIAEGIFTFGNLVRVMAGVMAGKSTITVTGENSATVVFRDVTDASDILTAQMLNSTRTSTTLAP